MNTEQDIDEECIEHIYPPITAIINSEFANLQKIAKVTELQYQHFEKL